ncbi:putative nucleoprotein [Culex rhabdo-like virus Los Angeles]|uniref:Nucleoprotein n=1 Tax=Culex rhabdo-like virus Los Angeles TaxID=2849718 RepID=A0A346M1Z5_9RHAB|nr:putative nucleoprotein [Culex rhabdo-like virus]AXQ04770.1 putative nucleoprotein [Culex rhabdo-like virus Los Angeles]AXQ04837.1 putative nucleoprotein [Culex mosquito virus 2]
MALNRVVRRVSRDADKRTEVRHMTIGTEKEIGYPSEWFGKNPNRKPGLLVMHTEGDVRNGLHATVNQGFREGTLDHRVAVRFLFDEFCRNPGLLQEDWTSFGIRIGLKGNNVNLRSMFEVAETETAAPIMAGAAPLPDNQILKFVIAICAMYRLSLIPREEYRTQVITNVNNLLIPLGGDRLDMTASVENYKKWLAYQPYTKMMAAIDMMLNEFPYHIFAPARIGTIVTRFKDCSALLSTQTITKTLGLDFMEFAEWIWTTRCADQFLRLIRGGEEMDNSRSYAMYFMDLGLSGKSPYSASVNPDLHFFYHVIGVSAGLTRSRNARFVGNPEINNILANAMVLHHVMGSFATLGQQFSDTGVPLAVDDDPEEIQEAGQIPQNKNPEVWLGYIVGRNGLAPGIITRRAAREWLQHPESRDDTIGKYLYNHAAGLLEQE